MSDESRQAVKDAYAEVLRELDDETLVEAIDALIVARITDALMFMDELKSMKSQGGLATNYMEREERLRKGEEWP